MKKYSLAILMFFSVVLFIMLSSPGCQGKDFVPSAIGPPEIEELYMVIIRDPDAQVLALEKGDIDILGDIHRPVDVERLSANEDIDLSLAQAFHAFFLGFNVRKEPWSRIELRQAAWHSIPREAIVRDIFSGYAAPLSTFLPPASPYFEKDVEKYPYDPEKARTILAENGWKWNSDDILVPPGSDIPLETARILSPTAQVAPTTFELTSRIAGYLSETGIPVEVEPMDFTTMLSKLDNQNFDMYVLAWTMTRDPDSLFAFYHSSMDIKGGYNLPGIHDPELDKVLEELKYAPDRKTGINSSSEAQKMLSELAPVIPVYSRYSIGAVSKKWDNILKTELTTGDNIWTLIQAEPARGEMEPLYWCLADEPRGLNPFASSSAYDWQVLGIVYESLIAIDPYDLEDIPWLAKSWEIETIQEEEKQRTVLTFQLRDDIKWHDGTPFTANDVKATIEFMKNNRIPRYLDNVDDVKEITIPDSYTLRVTMNGTSFWYLHRIGGLPLLPAHIIAGIDNWQNWQPSRLVSPENPDVAQLCGTGPYIFEEYRPGEFVRFRKNPYFTITGQGK